MLYLVVLTWLDWLTYRMIIWLPQWLWFEHAWILGFFFLSMSKLYMILIVIFFVIIHILSTSIGFHSFLVMIKLSNPKIYDDGWLCIISIENWKLCFLFCCSRSKNKPYPVYLIFGFFFFSGRERKKIPEYMKQHLHIGQKWLHRCCLCMSGPSNHTGNFEFKWHTLFQPQPIITVQFVFIICLLDLFLQVLQDNKKHVPVTKKKKICQNKPNGNDKSFFSSWNQYMREI